MRATWDSKLPLHSRIFLLPFPTPFCSLALLRFSSRIGNHCAMLGEFLSLPVSATKLSCRINGPVDLLLILTMTETNWVQDLVPLFKIFRQHSCWPLLSGRIIRRLRTSLITFLRSGENYKCFLLLRFVLKSLKMKRYSRKFVGFVFVVWCVEKLCFVWLCCERLRLVITWFL